MSFRRFAEVCVWQQSAAGIQRSATFYPLSRWAQGHSANLFLKVPSVSKAILYVLHARGWGVVQERQVQRGQRIFKHLFGWMEPKVSKAIQGRKLNQLHKSRKQVNSVHTSWERRSILLLFMIVEVIPLVFPNEWCTQWVQGKGIHKFHGNTLVLGMTSLLLHCAQTCLETKSSTQA